MRSNEPKKFTILPPRPERAQHIYNSTFRNKNYTKCNSRFDNYHDTKLDQEDQDRSTTKLFFPSNVLNGSPHFENWQTRPNIKCFLEKNAKIGDAKNFEKHICESASYKKKLQESDFRIYNSKKQLPNLHGFLKRVFLNDWVIKTDLQVFNKNEKSILIHIIKSKKYSLFSELCASINGGRFDSMDWKNFEKRRRKEEYLKYGFKLILKTLQKLFMDEQRQLSVHFPSDKMKLIFYLFYFYELETGKTWDSLLQSLLFKKKLLKCYPRTIQHYILPEMGSQSTFSKVKSISKEYLIKFANSGDFSSRVLRILIDMNLFFGYCLDFNWGQIGDSRSFNEIDRAGIKLFRLISHTNQVELSKLFSEWDNRVNSEALQNPDQANTVLIIKKTIQRKNFKFPWTFKEIHHSFFESFISFLEVVLYPRLINTEKGIFWCGFNN